MTVQLDASYGDRSVLAWCPRCPSFRELCGSRREAQLAGADHAKRVHGDADQAAKLRESAAKAQPRHAHKPR